MIDETTEAPKYNIYILYRIENIWLSTESLFLIFCLTVYVPIKLSNMYPSQDCCYLVAGSKTYVRLRTRKFRSGSERSVLSLRSGKQGTQGGKTIGSTIWEQEFSIIVNGSPKNWQHRHWTYTWLSCDMIHIKVSQNSPGCIELSGLDHHDHHVWSWSYHHLHCHRHHPLWPLAPCPRHHRPPPSSFRISCQDTMRWWDLQVWSWLVGGGSCETKSKMSRVSIVYEPWHLICKKIKMASLRLARTWHHFPDPG